MNLQEAITRYKKTNDPKLLEHICKIIEPFILKNAWRLKAVLPLEFDDIKQELYITLLKRIKSYKPSKGKFLTYLCNTFKGDPTQTLISLVSKKRGGDRINHYLTLESLNEVVDYDDEDHPLERLDQLEDSKQGEQVISYALLKGLRHALNENELKVFNILYNDPTVSNSFIERKLGLTRQKVVGIRKKIKEKSKKLMGIKKKESIII